MEDGTHRHTSKAPKAHRPTSNNSSPTAGRWTANNRATESPSPALRPLQPVRLTVAWNSPVNFVPQIRN